MSANFTIQDNVIVGNASPNTPTNSISISLFNSLNRYPNFVGQIIGETGEEITFAELKDQSIRCALWLKQQNVGKGDFICVSTPNQKDDCIPVLATLFVGAICNPWTYSTTYDVSCRFFKTFQPKVVFACKNSIDRLVKAAKESNVDCKFVVYGQHSKYPSLRSILAQQNKNKVDEFYPVEIKNPESQVGLILFTSGTTCEPKNVMISYDCISKHRMKFWHIPECESALWYQLLSYTIGFFPLIACIQHRVTRVIHTQYDAIETTNIVKKYKVQWLNFRPTLLPEMYEAKVFNQENYASVKFIVCAGMKCKPKIVDAIREILPHTFLCIAYGLTETGSAVVVQHRNHTSANSIGYVIGNIKMKVTDSKTGSILGPKQVGELCFKPNFLILGYYKDPKKTEKLIDDEGWLHTGDLGYFTEEGEVFLTERINRVVFTQHCRISLPQMEDKILEHPDVAEAVVVPGSDDVHFERLIVFVVKVAGSKVTPEELIALLPNFNEIIRMTVEIIFLDKFPRLPSQKVNIKNLIERAKICEK